MDIEHKKENKIKKPFRRPFTFEEDQILINNASDSRQNDWEKISSLLHDRTPRQCRERWNKFLSSNINNIKWTKDEDDLLLSLINIYGIKWAKIASTMKGKSRINVKNRYKQLISQNSKLHIQSQNELNSMHHQKNMYSSNILTNNPILTQKAMHFNTKTYDSLKDLFDSLKLETNQVKTTSKM